MSEIEKKMKTSMKVKLLKLLLGISFISLLIFLSISSFYMKKQGTNSLNASMQLGSQAAEESKTALKNQTESYMLSMVKSQAIYVDSRFDKVESGVNVLYEYAKEITSNPQQFKNIDTYYKNSKPKNPDKVSVVNLPSGISRKSVLKEINLLSNMDHVFNPTYGNDDDVLAVYMGTESGIYKRFPWKSTISDTYDPRKRSWYKEGASKKEVGWTMPYIGESVKTLMVTCYKGVYTNDNRFIGVVAADVTIESLLKLVSSQIKNIGDAYVIDQKGNVIAYPGKTEEYDYSKADNLLKSKNKKFREIVNEMISGKSGIKKYIDDNKKEKFLAYAPITNSKWSIGVEIPVDKIVASANRIEQEIKTKTEKTTSEIDKTIKSAQLNIIIVFIFIIVIIGIIGKNMAEKASKPIMELTNAVKLVGSGNLDHCIEVDTGDEVQVLSEAFNKMNLDLKQYIKELKETTAEKEKIESELGVAKRIQASMLPRIFPAFPDREEFDIFASMRPAKEVGGDYYDFFLIGQNKLCFIMADVSGKGVPASLFMVIAKTLMKNEALRGIHAEEILYNVNNTLMKDNDEFLFVTTFLSILDIETGEVEYSNGGHNPPLICRSGKDEFEYLTIDKNFVVGTMPDFEYTRGNLALNKGDILYLYTDGVTEAMNIDNVQYSETRLKEKLSSIKLENREVNLIENTIKKDLKIFVGKAEQSDDITMLILKYKGIN